MNGEEADVVRIAFEQILDAAEEPAARDVVDAAVAGGRRARRRRLALSATGTMLFVALTATAVTALPGAQPQHRPVPLSPPSVGRPSPDRAPSSASVPTPVSASPHPGGPSSGGSPGQGPRSAP
ncbi:hypothetical protein K7472_10585 [Streptomyces sp. PTM05]|uniref:Uncharacterized protein n=1 Tax=Streptantibioticus parmotrematis TaxID=2873249 RepID=A0ABS7QQ22_9ACTN|nr:hypothetical protein [Streptantibioticus parmotrematis]MBY8885291.1 hypothetical protein [Streptantibioticus parmotrematis]